MSLSTRYSVPVRILSWALDLDVLACCGICVTPQAHFLDPLSVSLLHLAPLDRHHFIHSVDKVYLARPLSLQCGSCVWTVAVLSQVQSHLSVFLMLCPLSSS